MAESWQVVWVAVFISGHHHWHYVLHSLDCPGYWASMLCPVPMIALLNMRHQMCKSYLIYIHEKPEKLFILNKSREACIMYQPGDQGLVWAGAGRCCLSSSRLSWFSENFSPPVPYHWPFPVMCCVCTSQAHYNADDTAAQRSFMSSLLPPSNIECTNNVYSMHTFEFHRLYQIVKLRVNVKRQTSLKTSPTMRSWEVVISCHKLS